MILTQFVDTRTDSLSVVSSFCAALGFMIYGGRYGYSLGIISSYLFYAIKDRFFVTLPSCFCLFRLFVMLRRFPIESRGRQKKLHEVCSSTSY